MIPYPHYKNTNLPWLPKIPHHWDVMKIREQFVERREKVSDKDFSPLSVSRGGIVPQISTVAKSDDGDNRKRVKKGDFVINSRSDRKASSGVSIYNGSVSLINIVLEPRDDTVKGFYHYLLKSTTFVEEFYRNGRGIVADLWTTRFTEMKGISIPLPPKEEQEKIVRYLDVMTAKINTLIRVKKKQIALLTEQKQALINQAVTQGLNPNVERKDSGIDWLGPIPSHWKTLSLKRILKTPMVDGPHETPVFHEAGIPFVSAEASHDGRIYLSECRGYISVKDHELYCKKIKPQRNDIFIVKSGSTTGKTVIVDFDEEFSIWSPLALVRSIDSMDIRFIFFALSSSYFQKGIQDNWSYGTQPNIGMKTLKNLPVAIPPMEEQHIIRCYLDDVMKKHDDLIAKLQREIEMHAEYKTSLISAVVTGQVDIRAIELPACSPDTSAHDPALELDPDFAPEYPSDAAPFDESHPTPEPEA